MIKWSIHQEYIPLLNVYLANKNFKAHKAILLGLEGGASNPKGGLRTGLLSFLSADCHWVDTSMFSVEILSASLYFDVNKLHIENMQSGLMLMAYQGPAPPVLRVSGPRPRWTSSPSSTQFTATHSPTLSSIYPQGFVPGLPSPRRHPRFYLSAACFVPSVSSHCLLCVPSATEIDKRVAVYRRCNLIPRT